MKMEKRGTGFSTLCPSKQMTPNLFFDCEANNKRIHLEIHNDAVAKTIIIRIIKHTSKRTSFEKYELPIDLAELVTELSRIYKGGE
jgi:hypothetical protein